MDQLTALRVFDRAAERGSFVAASRDLGLSASAVSKNIRELEEHLGARLFHRTTRRIALTEIGAVYLSHVRRVLEDLDEADAVVGAARGEVRGRLKVSAPMTFSLLTLSAVLPDFLVRHPGLQLDLHLDDRRVDLLKEGIDLALRATPSLEDSSLVARRIGTLQHVVCASAAYVQAHGVPQHPDELGSHRCVQFGLAAGHATWSFEREGQARSVAIHAAYRVNSSLAIRDALRAGYGVGRIPVRYVQDDLADGSLVAFLQDWSMPAVPMYAVYPSRRYLQPKVRAFLGFVEEILGTP